jgi:hypothetical protein
MEAGTLLNVAARTAAFRRNRMTELLNVRSAAALIEYAIKNRIV